MNDSLFDKLLTAHNLTVSSQPFQINNAFDWLITILFWSTIAWKNESNFYI